MPPAPEMRHSYAAAPATAGHVRKVPSSDTDGCAGARPLPSPTSNLAESAPPSAGPSVSEYAPA
jgi:hypothetical protein